MSFLRTLSEDESALSAIAQELAALREEIVQLRLQLAAKDEQIAKLTSALESSRRSGKRQAAPFSKGESKKAPKKPGRKKGKDYGPKARRQLPQQVDETLQAPLPCACPDCGGLVIEDGVLAQYQTEIPTARPVCRQFNVHKGKCEDCGRRLQGRHPLQTSDATGAAASMLGPRAVALASQLNKQMGLSVGKVQDLLDSLFGLKVSRGGLSQAIYRTAQRLDPTFEAMKLALPRKPVITPDETGWRVGGHSAWLWVFEAVDLVVYGILPGRGFEDATETLPADYGGGLSRDGWSAYLGYDQARHQSCLGHLLRRCSELLEVAKAGAARVPKEVQRILKGALALRDRRDDDEISAAGLSMLAGKLQARMERLLSWKPKVEGNRKLLSHLRREHALGALFLFLDDAEVPATNHRAEQAIRPAVVNRKVWGGNRTWNGAMAQERLMSVIATARRQGLDVLELIAQVLMSPGPMILPLHGLGPPIIDIE